jgi:tyrosine-specific transport protein
MVKGKLFGTLLIVAGTTIGASMLALPLKTAKIGFVQGTLFMAFAWFFMLANSYIILLVTKPYSYNATFHTIVKDVFGLPGWVLMTTAILWLFYSLLAAYACGASNLLSVYLKWPPQVIGTVIFGLFSTVIVMNTSATDYINRWMFMLKLSIFALILWPLALRISAASTLELLSPRSLTHAAPTALGVLLIYITSFGFHGSITSLIKYNEGDRKLLRRAFFGGTLLSALLYLGWIFISLALTGKESCKHYDITSMIGYMAFKSGYEWVGIGLNLFAILAILTSFLGVGLGLSNYFRDVLAQTKLPMKKAFRGIFTFLPPYLIMMIDPSIFVQALEFAGVALVFIAVLMPNLILQKQHYKGTVRYNIWVQGGSLIMLFGALILIPLYFITSL